MNRKRLLLVFLLLLIPAGLIIAGAIRENEVMKDTGVVVLVIYIAIGWQFGQDSKKIRR
jgi:NhaP-type Na+/H+ and K+/H+ antiporter